MFGLPGVGTWFGGAGIQVLLGRRPIFSGEMGRLRGIGLVGHDAGGNALANTGRKCGDVWSNGLVGRTGEERLEEGSAYSSSVGSRGGGFGKTSGTIVLGLRREDWRWCRGGGERVGDVVSLTSSGVTSARPLCRLSSGGATGTVGTLRRLSSGGTFGAGALCRLSRGGFFSVPPTDTTLALRT